MLSSENNTASDDGMVTGKTGKVGPVAESLVNVKFDVLQIIT